MNQSINWTIIKTIIINGNVESLGTKTQWICEGLFLLWPITNTLSLVKYKLCPAESELTGGQRDIKIHLKPQNLLFYTFIKGLLFCVKLLLVFGLRSKPLQLPEQLSLWELMWKSVSCDEELDELEDVLVLLGLMCVSNSMRLTLQRSQDKPHSVLMNVLRVDVWSVRPLSKFSSWWFSRLTHLLSLADRWAALA